MKKKHKKLLKMLIFILIIVIIILLILLFKEKKQLNNVDNQVKYTNHYYDYTLKSTNSILDVYKGNVPAYKISNKIEMVYGVLLPDIYESVNNKSNDELLEFYEKEKDRIEYCAGITTANEFIEFINKALKVGCDFKDYNSISYQVDSYEKNDNEESIKIIVNYNNGKSFVTKMHINPLSLKKIDARFEIE